MRTTAIFLFCFLLGVGGAGAQRAGRYSVEIDLQEQQAYLIQDRTVVLVTPISSGRSGHLTGRGTFTLIEKEQNHFSNMYGKIVDARGNTIVADADADMPLSAGARFVPAPMRYFMRFNGAEGMHAGFLPGYPASHGCVRLPEANAIAFFEAVEVGTPVTVFGTTPTHGGRDNGYSNLRRRQPQVRRQFDPRYQQPQWWR